MQNELPEPDFFRKAVEASGEIIFMTNAPGTITYVNPEFVRVYGYTRSEVVGQTTPRILKSGTVSAQEYSDFWRRLLDGEVVRRELVNRTKDGKLLRIETSVNPIAGDNGKIAGFLAVQRDVTERKQLEQQFLQAQKMEAVGQLAGGIAHDFNNLLTAILGYSELLLEGMGPTDPNRSEVEQICQAGSSAASLVRKLLAFSRRQVFQPSVLNLNDIVSNSRQILDRVISEDVQLVLQLEPRPWQVKADPTQIEQVIMNLAVNARDAMPQGGALTIRTANIQLDERRPSTEMSADPGPYVLLSVSDTGEGMTPDTQSHLFEPFFTTKGRDRGTGLGLSTVYGIVHQSGGHIVVESDLGRGSTFSVYLPRVDAVDCRPPADSIVDREALAGSETVLVVDDNDEVLELVRASLQRYGYRVLIAGNAEEAVALCERQQGAVHLLLSDVVMPGLNGPALAARLTTEYPGIRVLYMSGHTKDATLRHGVTSGDTTLLQKPFTPRTLARAVRSVLAARKSAPGS